VFVLAFVAILSAIVAVGLGGRGPAAPGVDGSPVVLASQTTGPGPSPGTTPGSTPDMAPVVASTAGPIEILARRHTETMYVHTEVYVEHVTWVFVSLQDSAARILGWASISVPGAAGPGVEDGPVLRIDVELTIPAEAAGRSIWIQANAYDSAGQVTATTRFEIAPDGGPGEGAHAVEGEIVPGASLPAGDATPESAATAPVTLTSPVGTGTLIAGATVAVEGRLRIRAARVEVTLLGEGRLVIASQMVETSNRDGGIRPIRAPTLDLLLAIPTPRPVGPAALLITAFDASGTVIGSMERAIEIGQLVMQRPPPGGSLVGVGP
jgi:hypothetical protein